MGIFWSWRELHPTAGAGKATSVLSPPGSLHRAHEGSKEQTAQILGVIGAVWMTPQGCIFFSHLSLNCPVPFGLGVLRS